MQYNAVWCTLRSSSPTNDGFVIISNLYDVPWNTKWDIRRCPSRSLWYLTVFSITFRRMRGSWSWLKREDAMMNYVFPCASFLPPSATTCQERTSVWAAIPRLMQRWPWVQDTRHSWALLYSLLLIRSNWNFTRILHFTKSKCGLKVPGKDCDSVSKPNEPPTVLF